MSGIKFALDVENETDLLRGLRHSREATISIPALDFSFQSSSTSGIDTNVKQLMQAIIEDIRSNGQCERRAGGQFLEKNSQSVLNDSPV